MTSQSHSKGREILCSLCTYTTVFSVKKEAANLCLGLKDNTNCTVYNWQTPGQRSQDSCKQFGGYPSLPGQLSTV